MIKKIILFAFILVSFQNYGQRKISGRLTDSKTSQPIKNVHVTVTGSPGEAFTNQFGFFEIAVGNKVAKKLVASHVAYGVSEMDMPDQDKFMAKLRRLTFKIPEVDLRSFHEHVQKKNSESVQFSLPSESASFNGGQEGLIKYLGEKIQLHNQIKDDIIDSNVEVSFTVASEGSVTHVVVRGDTLPGIGKIIKSIFFAMPKWQPAMQQGEPCDQDFILKIFYGNLIYSVAQQPAAFPGDKPGELKLFYKYVEKNAVYPKEAKAKKIKGSVFVEFVLNKSGEVVSNQVKVVKGLGYGLDDEAIRLIKKSPNWTPAMQNGNPVYQSVVIPIKF